MGGGRPEKLRGVNGCVGEKGQPRAVRMGRAQRMEARRPAGSRNGHCWKLRLFGLPGNVGAPNTRTLPLELTLLPCQHREWGEGLAAELTCVQMGSGSPADLGPATLAVWASPSLNERAAAGAGEGALWKPVGAF